MEVDVESHGQRRRCHRRGGAGMPRGHGGPWWHGMRGGGGGAGFCGPWGMRGRFGCHPRGRWCAAPPPPPAWCRQQPANATTTVTINATTGTAEKQPAGTIPANILLFYYY